jgi:hypothetical protein
MERPHKVSRYAAVCVRYMPRFHALPCLRATPLLVPAVNVAPACRAPTPLRSLKGGTQRYFTRVVHFNRDNAAKVGRPGPGCSRRAGNGTAGCPGCVWAWPPCPSHPAGPRRAVAPGRRQRRPTAAPSCAVWHLAVPFAGALPVRRAWHAGALALCRRGRHALRPFNYRMVPCGAVVSAPRSLWHFSVPPPCRKLPHSLRS